MENAIVQKLVDNLNAHLSNDFVLKHENRKKSLYCLELSFYDSKKSNSNIICTFYFECVKKIIYIEDYTKIYSGSISHQTNELLVLRNYFKSILSMLTSGLKEINNNSFVLFQLTTRIPESFDYLREIGFEKKEILNHYGNTKFQLLLN